MSASAVDYAYLRQLVYSHSHNVLEPSRDYLFDARLSRLLQRHGLAHPGELVEHLRRRRDPFLERAIAEAMMINETSFFRDGRPFELLRTEILPKLIDVRQETRALRIWSAACSTGQESLSVAMLIREHFPFLSDWTVQIEGTDISAEVVRRARQGRYHRIEMNRGLPARFIVRYFHGAGEDWVAKPEILALCAYREANLCIIPLPFPSSVRFDIILLRNVMLYFSPETRRALLAGIHSLLASDGSLFLGSTEQPGDPSLWTPVLAGGTCFFRPRLDSPGSQTGGRL